MKRMRIPLPNALGDVSGAVASESARRAARVLDDSFAVVGRRPRSCRRVGIQLPLKGVADDLLARRSHAPRERGTRQALDLRRAERLSADARRALNRTVAYERPVYAVAPPRKWKTGAAPSGWEEGCARSGKSSS